MSLTLRAVIGLIAGLVIGIVISRFGDDSLLSIIPLLKPIGALWVNALQMTVVPLVVSLLITGVGSSSDALATGKVGFKALILFVIMLLAAAAFAALVTPPLLSWLPIDSSAALSVQNATSVGERASALPSFGEWLVNLIPVNPIKAAAEGAMLPLIIFTLLFGFALTRIAPDLRETTLTFLRAVAEVMFVIIHWVLWFAPIGIFALVLPLAADMGISTVGALIYYVVLASALYLVVALLQYPLVAFLGGISPDRFARAAAPAQVVALSSQSSLVSLPAMLEGAEKDLRLPAHITSFALPLAVAVFRLSGPIRMTVGALFIAHLYGISLSSGEIATVAFTSVLMSIGGVGLPGGAGFFVIVPVFLSVGLPVEGVGILLAVDTVPDMFQTVNNVTADMAVTTVVARFSRSSPNSADSDRSRSDAREPHSASIEE